MKIKKGLLIAFGELFLKSEGVQRIFKKRLALNLSFFLKKSGLNFNIFPLRERIFIETEEISKAQKIVKNIFGISWFSPVLFLEGADLKDLSSFIFKNYPDWIKKEETFALRIKGGSLKYSSLEIIEEVARRIDRKVNLNKAKKEIFIEQRKAGWFLYFKKKKGAQGLPVGSGENVLSLVSGGIDSPVASYLAAKRGSKNIWLHFHSFPLVSKKSIEKVLETADIFLSYQNNLKIYLFPFSKIQMEIRTKTPSKYRILLYRRLMFKIAEKIALKENCYCLVTGESLAQVSSQTLPNIQIIEKPVSIPTLRPLIFMDKEEIINLSKKIKTFTISIKPQEDCCTLFTPKHSTAKGSLKEVEKIEKTISLTKLINQAFKEVEIVEK